jgi:hypothetical protein
MGNSVPTKVLVLTVGVGRDVVRSLRLALEYHNPSFVLFLCTPQSRPHVDALLSQHPPVPDHHVEAFTETADAEKLALLYEDVIRSQLFRKRGLRPEQVYVDYTRGTKAMSAAADYVAIDLELAGVSYITGDADERGQVITGTERLLSFRPLDLVFRRSWRTLADLFIWSTRCLAPGCGCGLPLSPQTGPDFLAHADRRAEVADWESWLPRCQLPRLPEEA